MPIIGCRNYSKNGFCRFGDRCRFSHVQCDVCGGWGHYSENCPSVCGLCWSINYKTNDCPTQFARLQTADGYIIRRLTLPSLASHPESPLEHSPETLLEHARQYLKQKKPDLKQACEKVWACASFAVNRVAGVAGIQLKGHDAKSMFVQFLVERGLVNDENNSFWLGWKAAESCHSFLRTSY